MTGIQPERAPTIVAGVVILMEVMRAFGLNEIEVSENDILHGAASRPPPASSPEPPGPERRNRTAAECRLRFEAARHPPDRRAVRDRRGPFAVASLPGASSLSETADSIVYFVGSIFFTTAAFDQLRLSKSDPTERTSVIAQFAGTLAFNVSTFLAVRHGRRGTAGLGARRDRFRPLPRLEHARGPRDPARAGPRPPGGPDQPPRLGLLRPLGDRGVRGSRRRQVPERDPEPDGNALGRPLLLRRSDRPRAGPADAGAGLA